MVYESRKRCNLGGGSYVWYPKPNRHWHGINPGPVLDRQDKKRFLQSQHRHCPFTRDSSGPTCYHKQVFCPVRAYQSVVLCDTLGGKRSTCPLYGGRPQI